MSTEDEPQTFNAFNSIVPAVIFLVLAFVWSDASDMLRYALAAAGIAFAVEGLIRYVRHKRLQ